MEITDFMGLLLPKSFTTDRLAKIYFCFYFIIFLWQNKDHSLSEAIIFHWILCFDRCHELCFLCPDPPLFWFHTERMYNLFVPPSLHIFCTEIIAVRLCFVALHGLLEGDVEVICVYIFSI